MIEKYESERARAEHAKAAALASLRSALDGKLSSGVDAQVRVPALARKRAERRAVTVHRNPPSVL